MYLFTGIGFGLSSGFGQKAPTTTQSGTFGTSFNLGSSTNTATVQPLGLNFSASN